MKKTLKRAGTQEYKTFQCTK